VDAEKLVGQKWRLLKATMDERARRLWAGSEADAIGYGGVAAVARATGMAISTVRKGRDEARSGARPEDVVKVRRSAGQRPFELANPEVWPALEKLVDPVTRGDPKSPLRWTCKSTAILAAELFAQHGIRMSDRTVAKLLRDHGYSLQAATKTVEGKQYPDRNAQFEHLNAKAQDCLDRGVPFISVDTKKKELVGNFKNAGREWQPQDEPELVDVYDFPDDAVGKAVPYGVYDVAANDGFVNVGTDHDTPVFAVTSTETWWKRIGSKRYPGAKEIFITADAGDSNGYRSHVWKAEPRCSACSARSLTRGRGPPPRRGPRRSRCPATAPASRRRSSSGSTGWVAPATASRSSPPSCGSASCARTSAARGSGTASTSCSPPSPPRSPSSTSSRW